MTRRPLLLVGVIVTLISAAMLGLAHWADTTLSDGLRPRELPIDSVEIVRQEWVGYCASYLLPRDFVQQLADGRGAALDAVVRRGDGKSLSAWRPTPVANDSYMLVGGDSAWTARNLCGREFAERLERSVAATGSFYAVAGASQREAYYLISPGDGRLAVIGYDGW